MCYRTLDSGELDFSTERFEQKCCKEVGADNRSIEEIGPQEKGESALCPVGSKSGCFYTKKIDFLNHLVV